MKCRCTEATPPRFAAHSRRWARRLQARQLRPHGRLTTHVLRRSEYASSETGKPLRFLSFWRVIDRAFCSVAARLQNGNAAHCARTEVFVQSSNETGAVHLNQLRGGPVRRKDLKASARAGGGQSAWPRDLRQLITRDLAPSGRNSGVGKARSLGKLGQQFAGITPDRRRRGAGRARYRRRSIRLIVFSHHRLPCGFY